MGFTFSNLQLRYTAVFDADAMDALAARIAREYALKQVASRDEADVVTAIYHPEGATWVTVVSDVFDGDPEKQTALAKALSQEYGVPALAISCFDSDFLMLNWLDAERGHDLFASTGSAAAIGLKGMRRSNFAAWRKVLADAEGFKAAMRQDNLFAEEAMIGAAEHLHLPVNQGQACLELLEEMPGAKMYYYAAAVEPDDTEKPILSRSGSSARALIGMRAHVGFVNEGGASRGVAVILDGADLLSGAVRVADSQILTRKKQHEYHRTPIQFERRMFKDGKERLIAEAPDVRLQSPPKGLPPMKAFEARINRSIGLEFILEAADPEGGNYAPVTVFMIPKENWAGQAQHTLPTLTQSELEKSHPVIRKTMAEMLQKGKKKQK